MKSSSGLRVKGRWRRFLARVLLVPLVCSTGFSAPRSHSALNPRQQPPKNIGAPTERPAQPDDEISSDIAAYPDTRIAASDLVLNDDGTAKADALAAFVLGDFRFASFF